MKKINILIICVICSFFIRCTNDKATIIPNLTNNTSAICDTTAIVSYSAQIAPIIASNCISCHSSSAGTKLNDYANVRINALKANGSIYSAITADGNASPMPQGQPKLSECTILAIKKWIDNGTPNN